MPKEISPLTLETQKVDYSAMLGQLIKEHHSYLNIINMFSNFTPEERAGLSQAIIGIINQEEKKR